MSDLSKSFTLEEVEALLAAERERCAKVAEEFSIHEPRWDGWSARETAQIICARSARKIRSLAPQTIGGEG